MEVIDPNRKVEPELTLKKRSRRPTPKKILYPDLEISQILSWADAYYARHGRWPAKASGRVAENSTTTWCAIDLSLKRGNRGLQAGSSLALLLKEWRGHRHIRHLPPLNHEQILSWADAHFERFGKWPDKTDNDITEAPGEKWSGIDMQLRHGGRGLPGGTSLAKLIAEKRNIRNQTNLISFTEEQILAWADAYHTRTGRWPAAESGPILEAPGENWRKVNNALKHGLRGLAGGSSLAQLIGQRRGVRNQTTIPLLNEEQILAWVDTYYAREGRWPTTNSGSILEAPGETWQRINAAFIHGSRGLPGGLSLAQWIAQERGRHKRSNKPPFTKEQVLTWAQAHFARTGKWPHRKSGLIPEAPGENWHRVHDALVHGHRGLPGGSSLPQFLDRYCRNEEIS